MKTLNLINTPGKPFVNSLTRVYVILALMAAICSGCSASPNPEADKSGAADSTQVAQVQAEIIQDIVKPIFRELGRSVQNRPITAIEFKGKGNTRILIAGGIHGDEAETVSFSDSLVLYLESLQEYPFASSLTILPRLNPDGVVLKSRKNAHGIDLNRNFPTLDFKAGNPKDRYYGGKEPLSEPESQILFSLIDELKPDLVIMLHTPLNCVNYDGKAKEVAVQLSRVLSLPLKENIGYSTPGSVGTYYGKERSLPVITLEFPARNDLWSRFGRQILNTIDAAISGNR